MAAFEQSRRRAFLGIPADGFGFFTSVLLAGATGVLSACLTCFFAIFTLLIYNVAGHHNVDMADSYLYVAAPAGALVFVVSLVLLLSLWARNKFAGSHA